MRVTQSPKGAKAAAYTPGPFFAPSRLRVEHSSYPTASAPRRSFTPSHRHTSPPHISTSSRLRVFALNILLIQQPPRPVAPSRLLTFTPRPPTSPHLRAFASSRSTSFLSDNLRNPCQPPNVRNPRRRPESRHFTRMKSTRHGEPVSRFHRVEPPNSVRPSRPSASSTFGLRHSTFVIRHSPLRAKPSPPAPFPPIDSPQKVGQPVSRMAHTPAASEAGHNASHRHLLTARRAARNPMKHH